VLSYKDSTSTTIRTTTIIDLRSINNIKSYIRYK